MATFTTGLFIGSTGGGFMVEHLGFSPTSSALTLLYAVVMAADIAFLCLRWHEGALDDEEKATLLDKTAEE